MITHAEIFNFLYGMPAGGFTHTEIYEMPISLRNYYFKLFIDNKTKEQEAMKKAKRK